MLEIAAVVGVIGYFSFRNGQETISNFAWQLMTEVEDRVTQKLDTHLAIPHQINHLTVDAIETGQLDLQNFPLLERHLFRQMQRFPTAQNIVVGNHQGRLMGIYRLEKDSLNLFEIKENRLSAHYLLDQKGRRVQQQQNDAIATPMLPWYDKAIASGKPAWSESHNLVPSGEPGLTAITPLHDQQGNLKGVMAADIRLRLLCNFLHTLKGSFSGQTFILGRDGRLIATSSTFRTPKRKNANQPYQGKLVTDSQTELIRQTGQALIKQFGDLRSIRETKQFNFEAEGELTHNWLYNRQFAQVIPYRDGYGLDWLIVVVMPESDFIEKINKNNQLTLIMSVLALVGAIPLGLLTSTLIAKPILRLSRASRDLALGKLEDSVVDHTIITELEVLAHSFNQMTEHLQHSFDQVKIALQQSEERFTKIFRSSPDPIAISTLEEGRFLEVNECFLKLIGASREEIVGHTSAELGIWSSLEERQQVLQTLQETGKVQGVELTVESRTAQLVTVLLTAEVIELEGRTCLLTVGKDITGRKRMEQERQQAEDKLRQSEERFRGAFDHTAVGMAIVSPTDGKFLRVNPSYCKMLGYTEAEMLQLAFQDITLAEDLVLDLELYQQVLRGDIPHYRMKKRYRHREGHIVWGFLSTSLVRDSQHQPLCFVSHIQDISDLQKLEAALHENESRFQRLAATSPGIIYSLVQCLDRSFYFEYISPATETIFELKSEAIRDNAALVLQCIHPEDQKACTKMLIRCAITLEPLNYRWRIITPTGQLKWVQASSRAERREDGTIVWHGVLLDVSNGKQPEPSPQSAEMHCQFRDESNGSSCQLRADLLAGLPTDYTSDLSALDFCSPDFGCGFCQNRVVDFTQPPSI